MYSSSCSSIVPKSQKLRYGNSNNNSSSSGTTALLDHIAEMENLNKSEMTVSQSTSGISQLIPATAKSNMGSSASSNANDINTAHKSNCVANLPNSTNSNLNMTNNIKAVSTYYVFLIDNLTLFDAIYINTKFLRCYLIPHVLNF